MLVKAFTDLRIYDTFLYYLQDRDPVWATVIEKNDSYVTAVLHTNKRGWPIKGKVKDKVQELGLEHFSQGWNIDNHTYKKNRMLYPNNPHLASEPLRMQSKLNLI